MIHFINLFIYLLFISEGLASDDLEYPIGHSDCPAIDDINHAVMLPYPQDCNKYYSCFKGMAYLQQCPNNLHWSSLTYRCDYPDIAKCERSSVQVPANTIQQASSLSLPASLTSEIVYQSHTSDCSRYYKCQALACPSNYFWNYRTQKCDFPHIAQCPFMKDVNDLSNLNSSPVISLPIQTNQGEAFALHYPNNCAKFFQCQTMLCPINNHWNTRLQQCDLPQAAQCPLQPQIASNTMETSTAAIPTAFTAPSTSAVTAQSSANGSIEFLDCVQRCDGYLHHYLPHPNDCHKFIQCNGWSFIHTCPDNLFWNAKLNTCDRICVTN